MVPRPQAFGPNLSQFQLEYEGEILGKEDAKGTKLNLPISDRALGPIEK